MRRWRPDIVHETYYSDVCTGPGNVPKVLTVYDMISELFPESLPRRDDSSRLKRRAVARADHVICISRSTREDLLRLFDTRPEKVSYVHLGFERFAPQTGPSAAGAVPNRPFLLYVGARSGYKNFDAFLQSVAASPRLARDFSIVAFGGGSFTTAQQERIRSLGFGDGKVIHVAGDDALLGAMYEAARAFVYPSIYEGFGLPLLEAAAHDCPIACSNTSSMPEVIGDAAEFFDPRSAEGMTLAIERVVYSQARTGELLARGRERLAHFSWQKCARETASIYSTLL